MYTAAYDKDGIFRGVNVNGGFVPIDHKEDWPPFLTWYNKQDPKPFTFDDISPPTKTETKEPAEILIEIAKLTNEDKQKIIDRYISELLFNDKELAIRAGIQIALEKENDVRVPSAIK